MTTAEAIAQIRSALAAYADTSASDSAEDDATRYPTVGELRAALTALDSLEAEIERLRKIAGPASGNEPVAERDALLAQLQEADAIIERLREEVGLYSRSRDGH